MKKNLTYILLLAAVVFCGCRREVDDLFNESASERALRAQKEVKAALVAAESGWEMLYFPTPESHGYAFLCKFSEDGSVVFAAKNSAATGDTYMEEKSLWGTDGTQGCVLTFDTYNKIFHKMSDPGEDGVGYSGDYEFCVLETKADLIRLKGKKHGAYVRMIRLDANQSWKGYFQTIDNQELLAYKYNDGIEMDYFNGDTTYTMVYNKGTFTYRKNNADHTLGFIVTPTGWHFYSSCPMTDSTIVASDFVLNDDNSLLKCTQHENVFFCSHYSEPWFFTYQLSENKKRWDFWPSISDAATVSAWENVCEKAEAKGATITNIAYDQHSTITMNGEVKYNSLHITYLVDNKLFEGRINVNYEQTEDAITYSYKNYDNAILPLLKRINATQPEVAAEQIADIFCGTFTATSLLSKLNMIQMELTDGTRKIGVTVDNSKR